MIFDEGLILREKADTYDRIYYEYSSNVVPSADI